MSALGELAANPCLHEQGHIHLDKVGDTRVCTPAMKYCEGKTHPGCKASCCTGGETPSAVVRSSGITQPVPISLMWFPGVRAQRRTATADF